MNLAVRTRLTLWYSLVVAIVLCIVAVMSLVLLRRAMYGTVARALADSAEQAESRVREEVGELGSSFDTAAANETLASFAQGGTSIALYDNHGRLVGSSSPGKSLPEGGRGTRSRSFTAGGRRFVVVASQSAQPVEKTLTLVARTFELVIPLAIAISAGAGYLLARKALDPVATITRTAREITAPRLGARIELRNPDDELGQLATTLNDLLERLQRSFTTQQRFMADASHELRTPVAVIQGEADVALQRDRTADEYRESLRVIHKAAARMGRVVRDLLFLARSDFAPPQLRQEQLFVDDVIADSARGARALAAAAGVTIEHQTEGPMPARGDADLLEEMILTVVDNAVRHSKAGSVVRIAAGVNNGSYDIEIRDAGSGVPEEAREMIFERFYRADPARSRAAGETSYGSGAGLGLPIARAIARAHGGDVVLRSTSASGSTFVISLPRG